MASKNKLLTPSTIMEQKEKELKRKKEKELQTKLMNLKLQDKHSIFESSDDKE